MYNPHNSNNSRMEVVKFILLSHEKPVSDMYQRSFKFNTDMQTLNTLEDSIYRNNFITNIDVIKKCNNLISLTTLSDGLVEVNNGWNTKRLAFVLQVDVYESTTKKNIYFINGFTDFYDPILKMNNGYLNVNMLDPRMEFNINTITVLSELTDSTGRKNYQFRDKVTIVKKYGQAVDYESIMNDKCLVRTSDIIYDLYMGYPSNDELSVEHKDTNRSNANTMGYISNMLKVITDNYNLNKKDPTFRMTSQESYHNMANSANDYSSLNCPFLVALYKITGEPKPNKFTVGDLLSLFPYLDHVTDTINLLDKPENSKNILSTNIIDNTLQPTIGNLKALEFYQLLSSTCFDNMITRASIHVSNHPMVTPLPIAKVLGSESIFHTAFNNPSTIETIDAYLRNIVLPKLSHNNDIFIDIIADINILGLSSIAIKVNDDDPEVFRYNSSMDNTFSPYIANRDNKASIIEDVSDILDIFK